MRLRPLTPRDYDRLYELSTMPETGFRWRFRGRTPRPEDFVEMVWDNVLAQFAVSPIESNDLVGLVAAYGASPGRFAYFAVLTDPAYQGTGAGAEGLALFFDYLFRAWDFRKLYAEVFGFNLEQFGSAVGRVLVEEGCLREHEYFDGRYWDLHILALYRDTWMELKRDVDRFLHGE